MNKIDFLSSEIIQFAFAALLTKLQKKFGSRSITEISSYEDENMRYQNVSQNLVHYPADEKNWQNCLKIMDNG